MRRTTLSVLTVLTLAVVLQLGTGTALAAPKWVVGLATGSRGQARAQPAPTAPTGVTSSCSSSPAHSVTLTWSAVAHATSYNVLQSTSAATGPYSSAATVTTTSWTSASLAAGTYWYEVTAMIGTRWSGANSAASTKRTISSSLACT